MKQLTIRFGSALAALAIAGLALVPLAGAHADRQARSTATTVQVKGGEFFFKLSTKSVATPRKVTFVFKNTGHILHDFKISSKKTPLIGPGKTATISVTLKKGKYTYLCTVPGHAAAGMKGVFTVR